MDKEILKKYLQVLELDRNSDKDMNFSPSLSDVKRAYQHLKVLYTSDAMSAVTEPIEDEFSREDRQEILNRLEEAYKALVHYLVEKDRQEKEVFKKAGFIEDTVAEYVPEKMNKEKKKPGDPPPKSAESREDPELLELPEVSELLESQELLELPEAPEEPPEPKAPEAPEEPPEFEVLEEPGENGEEAELDQTILEEFGKYEEMRAAALKAGAGGPPPAIKPVKGRTLRKAREKLGVGIHELAGSTGISYKILVSIEKERYDELPEAGYLRWLVTTYARELKLDPKKAADDYMKRFRQWQRQNERE